MHDVDALLQQAGERWRAAQPAPPDVDGMMFTATGPQVVPVDRSVLRTLGLAAIGVAAALVIALVATDSRLGGGVGGQSAAVSAPASAGSAGPASCAVTRPAPPFVPPRPYPSVPPDLYASDWFGSNGLWTMLDRDGEIWAGAICRRTRMGSARRPSGGALPGRPAPNRSLRSRSWAPVWTGLARSR